MCCNALCTLWMLNICAIFKSLCAYDWYNECRVGAWLGLEEPHLPVCGFPLLPGVLFSVEVTSSHFALTHYLPCFFSATCGALTFRLFSVWSGDAGDDLHWTSRGHERWWEGSGCKVNSLRTWAETLFTLINISPESSMAVLGFKSSLCCYFCWSDSDFSSTDTLQAVFKTHFPGTLPFYPLEVLLFALLGWVDTTFVSSKEAISLPKRHFIDQCVLSQAGFSDRLLCGAVSCCFLCCHRWILSFAKTNRGLIRMLSKEWELNLTWTLTSELITHCPKSIRKTKNRIVFDFNASLRKAVYSGVVAFALAVVTFPEFIGSYMASQVGLKKIWIVNMCLFSNITELLESIRFL